MSTGLLHLLCLRAAGRIPDGDLAGLRTLLARGDHGACAARLLGAFPQSAAEIAALAALLPPETPLLPGPAADEDVDADPAALFVPFPPADLPLYATTAPLVVDETAGGTVDDLDRVLLDVLDPARTAGVWRCWRITRGPDDTVDAVRVYLVESTAPDDELPAIAERGQRALADAGHAAPVEVYRPDLPLPAYQWAARSRSALIRAPQPPGEVRLAADGEARLPVDDDEVPPFVTYLRSAPALTAHLRTDGAWVWPAGLADRLLDEGALADEGLLRHLRRCRADPPSPAGAVAVHRALAALVRTGAPL
ncbi:hypothetical protein ACGFI5_16935 [Micromonospora tulbaghiae]|uniref:Uncharacterized protein n=1 Tax=Micromonospora tulbaghiae TaxID=479978 RepID=A0ABY0KHK5_9ACTN|nr:hypothetical protein [Micromonospora tulbaghiae]MDX5459207.1 hypothetical protein [Micromonospora tulbaghiae]SCE73897.1 hypothetical protein GA0070562_2162 [Micromonospora tulbaghiae]